MRSQCDLGYRLGAAPYKPSILSGSHDFIVHPASLASNVKAMFTCLLDHVGQYISEGLQRASVSLNEAAASREKLVLGTSVSRRRAAAVESFMVAVQRCASSVAIVEELLLPVDGAHAASCEEMATAKSCLEGAAYTGLQQCIETVMAEVEGLLSAQQKPTDYRSPEDGMDRPTTACTRVIAYLSRVLEISFTALEGRNKQAFLMELGTRLHEGLVSHWQKYTFNPSGGLRLKRDITDYGEYVRSFNVPSVDEKFESLSLMANVFTVAPERLATLREPQVFERMHRGLFS